MLPREAPASSSIELPALHRVPRQEIAAAGARVELALAMHPMMLHIAETGATPAPPKRKKEHTKQKDPKLLKKVPKTIPPKVLKILFLRRGKETLTLTQRVLTVLI